MKITLEREEENTGCWEADRGPPPEPKASAGNGLSAPRPRTDAAPTIFFSLVCQAFPLYLTVPAEHPSLPSPPNLKNITAKPACSHLSPSVSLCSKSTHQCCVEPAPSFIFSHSLRSRPIPTLDASTSGSFPKLFPLPQRLFLQIHMLAPSLHSGLCSLERAPLTTRQKQCPWSPPPVASIPS